MRRSALPWAAAAFLLAVAAPPTAAQVASSDLLSCGSEFNDDFGYGQFGLGGTGYVITARRGLARWFWCAGSAPSFSRVEVTATIQGGPLDYGLGLAFGRTTRETPGWFTLFVAPDGHFKLVLPGGANAFSWRRHPAIRTGVGASNTIAVELRGTSVAMYANGVLLETWQADRDVAGYLAVEQAEMQSVRWEGLRITPLAGAAAQVK